VSIAKAAVRPSFPSGTLKEVAGKLLRKDHLEAQGRELRVGLFLLKHSLQWLTIKYRLANTRMMHSYFLPLHNNPPLCHPVQGVFT
jgi:hypothetical protein